jgi:RNA polymerase sigma-70 factor (ECF subfamily)
MMSQSSLTGQSNEAEPFSETLNCLALVQETSLVEPITEETAVVELVLVENRQIFTRLFEQYNGKICAYLAYLVGDDEVGHELAQDTFVKAWEGLSNLRNLEQPEAWLFRIARNTGIDYLRRRKIRQVFLPWTDNKRLENLSDQGFEDSVGEAEYIRYALARVQDKPRECLILYVIVGLSRQHIAKLLGINESSVSTYVSLGRKQFRDAYNSIIGEEFYGGTNTL